MEFEETLIHWRELIKIRRTSIIWERILLTVELKKEPISLDKACVMFRNELLHLYTLTFDEPKQARKEILEDLSKQYAELFQSQKPSENFTSSDLFGLYLMSFVVGNTVDTKQTSPIVLDDLNYLLLKRKLSRNLKSNLVQKETKCKMELSKIKPSLEKAEAALYSIVDELNEDQPPDTNQIFDAACLLKDRVSSDLIMIIVSAWKRELKHFIEFYSHAPYMAESHYFWGSSRDGAEFLDAVSHYRMMKCYGIGDFPETINSVEKHLNEFLMNSILEERSISFDLWVASRSEALCRKANQDLIQKALGFIIDEQHKDGWFAPSRIDYYQRETNPEPNTYYTALCALVILRLGDNNTYLERATEAINWLTKQARDSGAWSHAYTKLQPENRRKGRQGKSAPTIPSTDHLFTTLLAVEAIRRCDSAKYSYTLQKAEEWILSQQGLEGLWSEKAKDNENLLFSDVFLTTLVLEYFDNTGKQKRLNELRAIKEQLDTNAYKFAQRWLWVYLGVLLGIGVTLAILIYQLSWNVMEPWTYFIGLVSFFGSYLYFAMTKKEASPITIFHQIVESKKNKNYKDFDFDIVEYEKLIATNR